MNRKLRSVVDKTLEEQGVPVSSYGSLIKKAKITAALSESSICRGRISHAMRPKPMMSVIASTMQIASHREDCAW